MTTGRVYQTVIDKERNLEYGGKCVQVVPHIPMEVIERLKKAQQLAEADVVVIEVGGTIGEYENILFLEAARMMKLKSPKDVAVVMVSYLPVPSTLGEMKPRPTQHAGGALNSYGVQPDIIIARATRALDQKRKEKLAIQCNVEVDCIISAPDVESIYDVPLNFERDHFSDILLELLEKEGQPAADLDEWKKFAAHAHNGTGSVKIGIIGKYFDTGDFVLSDAYLSVIEAIKFSAFHLGLKPDIRWLNAKDYQSNPEKIKELAEYDGIIVPGGFGESGIEGKILGIQYAREHKIPYFGLCYGMQLMTVEYARNVVGLEGANTTEINPDTPHPIIDILPEQKEKLAKKDFGGSMRLGAYPCELAPGTIAREAYGSEHISERHRHRFEVNPAYVAQLEAAGLVFSGRSPDHALCEIAELQKSDHPFMLGTQFHPELRARPLSPHPLFTAFIEAAIAKSKR